MYILEYSITNRKSLQNSIKILNNINIKNQKDISIILIGNEKNLKDKREKVKKKIKI